MSEMDDFLLDDLKERELEILTLMAAGHSNNEIADLLYITKNTVRWYNKQIYGKLGTSRRIEAVEKAKRLGLIGEQPQPETPDTLTEPRHNLPHIATPFVGRDKEIKRISTILSQPYTPLLTVLGPGGMGKTRLAIESGHQLLPMFPDGIYLFELAPLTHANQILTAILQTLRINTKESVDQKQLLFNYCKEKKCLFLFDNFEHILAGADLVDELIKAAPNCRILATTRERLNLYGETVYELQGLKKDGIALFEASARTVEPNFVQSEADRPHVERIVEIVGGLPLGIILAAAWVDSLDVEEIADEISRDLDMLATDMRNIPERQRSIRTVLSASWQKLSQSEQAACMKLAVFRGGFSRQAVKVVAEASVRILQKLQHKSFVQQVGERRFDLHPLVHQFTTEQLERAGHVEASRQQHLSYFHPFVDEALKPIEYGDHVYPLKEIEAEIDNIHAALDWGLRQEGEIRLRAIELTTAMYSYWDNRSYNDEGLHYYTVAIEQLEKSEAWANLLMRRIRFLRQLARFKEAAIAANQLAEYASQQDIVSIKLSATLIQIGVLLHNNDSHAALALSKQYLNQSEQAGDARHQFNALGFLAQSYSTLGELEQNIAIGRKVLQLAQQQENDVAMARATYNLAISLLDGGEVEEAQGLLEESLMLKRLIGDSRGTVSRLGLLACVAANEQRFDEAIALLEEADQLLTKLNAPARQCFTYFYWSFYHERQLNWSEAIRFQKLSLEVAREIGYVDRVVFGTLSLAHLYACAGLPRQALHYLLAVDSDNKKAWGDDSYPARLLTLSSYWFSIGEFTKSGRIFVHFERMKMRRFVLLMSADYFRNALEAALTLAELEQLRSEPPVEDIKEWVTQLFSELSAGTQS